MEMNKGEAEKCRDVGVKHLRAGNFHQAIKFLEKSLRMYPLPGVDAMIERAQSELTKDSSSPQGSTPSPNSSTPSTPGVRRREPHGAQETKRGYTPDQVEMVRKIKRCKTHYEVLGVVQTADENEIKKAYRKWALKLHPDKNSAPGAEDAFKAVGKAFTVLSDAEKRANYDRYGDRAESSTASQGARHYDEDISPEEIFNMFFGGGFHPRNRAHRAPQRQRSAQGARAHEPRSLAQFVQFLPLLIIFMLSMFSMPTTPDVPFSMQPTTKHNIQRSTQMSSVARGIPYYVDAEFDRKYTTHWRDLARVEQLVEQYHINHLSESCEHQKVKQKRMIYRARNSKQADREAAMRTALEMKLPACEKLRAVRRSRRK